MSNIANETPAMLKDMLSKALLKRIKKESFDIGYDVPQEMFKNLIEELHAKYGQTVVVLIDEYDKPILDHLDDTKTAAANRKVLRGFYGILKSMDPHLRLTFITGITKFTKTSIFSDMNNLSDITFSKKYSGICGISTSDLDECFAEHVKSLSAAEGFECSDGLRGKILAWYDGYSWDGRTQLLNPFSLLSFFDKESIANYWFASGTPNFLMGLMKEKPSAYTNLKNLEITELMLDLATIEKITVELLLFQTGYLTVKEVRKTDGAPVWV